MRAILLMLMMAGVAMGQVPKKVVPLDVKGDLVTVVKSFPVTITAPPGADLYIWSVPDAVTSKSDDNVLVILGAPKGTHRIGVVSLTIKIDFEKKSVEKAKDRGDTTLVVGDAPGPPVPPVPPGPTPAGAMRVLIVFESGDLPKMPAEQRDGVIRSLKFQRMLTDRSDKNGPNGRGWNIWERNQKGVELMEQWWQDAFARPRASTPFIHIWKGGTVVHEGPLPATAEEATALVTKFAGG